MKYTEKQIQIIATAEKLFAHKGFDGTSVRDIAEEAGINIAMISYYFGSKEKLMQALFEERTNEIKLKVETLLKDDSLQPIEKIWVIVHDYVQKVLNRQQFYKIMVCEQMLEKNPVITELLSELKKKNASLIEKLIRDGQEKGAFKKDIDLVFLMNTMVGTVTHTFINQKHYRFYNNLESLSDEAFHELLKEKIINHIKVLFKAILIYEA